MPGNRVPLSHTLGKDEVELKGHCRSDCHEAPAAALGDMDPKWVDVDDEFSCGGGRKLLYECPDLPMQNGVDRDTEGQPLPSSQAPDEVRGAKRRARRNIFSRIFNAIIPHGGLLSGAVNLACVTLGAGIMSIPSAFNTSGIIMAVFYLVIITSLTVLSITLLSNAMEKTGIYSFEGLARALFGRGGDIVAAVLMWILCFGASVGFVIAIGDILKPIFAHPKVPPFLQEKSGRRCIMSGVWLLFMLPLVLPKKINSLRYMSAVGVFFIVFFVICAIYHSIVYGLKDGIRKDLVMVRPGNEAVSGLSIFCFSYLCQVNVGRIIVENTERTTRMITLQAILSCSICATLYFLTGFFGYADFGPSLKGNILERYSPYQSPIFFVVFPGIIVKLCASFSLDMLACRTALFQVMHWDVETMPYWKHTLVSVPMAIGALILGLFVPDINIVFGLAGALSGGFIGFVFPALFVMYAGSWNLKKVGIWYYLATYFLLICGVVSIVFGTVSTVYFSFFV
ncbi:putative amino acid transporter aATP11 [Leishmania infantum JPCM5]|uniref:Amino_acid_transporter_aATP11_-_putative n=3 Tax=Leishmania donovani species complex TaxID=38574 RepID=A0A6L0XLQ4_LEIIN|nr:putative amino acid transporter aATP11 [Leishmania infantum JPCM5]AYU81246.1 Tryptophan/tyrosine permease family/Transmembrane amino acid transporter protein, putative [Leishmania donovani]CAC9517860.1 amino_acid_transporter_aATP11_-_putative [Leishmania infantum]CAM70376.1 putative amino acid transporter aATP11 [Leishmania infantum JPCM5]SUZ44263.1 amino_acid_transporter_aATP11_-_putative [Leishmania infantum]|eukprot:XP_001467320.1 putative amino acid transporter aATP11 [Leishmania infantum JPCM5]